MFLYKNFILDNLDTEDLFNLLNVNYFKDNRFTQYFLIN